MGFSHFTEGDWICLNLLESWMSTTNPQDIELVQTCVSQHGGALRSTVHQPCAKLSCQAGLLNWQVCTCRAQGEQRYSFLANIFGSMLFASGWILRPQRPHATVTFRLRCCVRWAPVAWHWSTPPRSCVMMRRWWSELCSALAWRWSLPLPGVARVLNRPPLMSLVEGVGMPQTFLARLRGLRGVVQVAVSQDGCAIQLLALTFRIVLRYAIYWRFSTLPKTLWLNARRV